MAERAWGGLSAALSLLQSSNLWSVAEVSPSTAQSEDVLATYLMECENGAQIC